MGTTFSMVGVLVMLTAATVLSGASAVSTPGGKVLMIESKTDGTDRLYECNSPSTPRPPSDSFGMPVGLAGRAGQANIACVTEVDIELSGCVNLACVTAHAAAWSSQGLEICTVPNVPDFACADGSGSGSATYGLFGTLNLEVTLEFDGTPIVLHDSCMTNPVNNACHAAAGIYGWPADSVFVTADARLTGPTANVQDTDTASA